MTAKLKQAREWVAWLFGRVEDLVYIGLAVLLAASAVVLLVDGASAFMAAVGAGELPARIVSLLDRILLILMIIEILYTVQVSVREHTLNAEPFLVVGLIAAVRRVLVLTAEFAKLVEAEEPAFRKAMIELGLLTILIVALVVSLAILRSRAAAVAAPREAKRA